MCASESRNVFTEMCFVALKTSGSVYVCVCVCECVCAISGLLLSTRGLAFLDTVCFTELLRSSSVPSCFLKAGQVAKVGFYALCVGVISYRLSELFVFFTK